MFASELKAHTSCDALLLLWEVALVSCKSHDESSLFEGCILEHFVHPVLNRVEGPFVRQIVADDRTYRVTVIQVNH